jgi:plastocyanin
MSSRKKGSRFRGSLVFFIPVVVVIAIVALGLISTISNQSGILVVDAYTSGRYAPASPVHALANVASATETTPFNLSLSQGEYTVVFGPVKWYVTPTQRSVVVSGGKTQFAVGVYSPVIREVTIGSEGFNSTSVTAKLGTTPVVWVNTTSNPVVLEVMTSVRANLSPGQNYTRVFQSTGTYTFSLDGTGYSGTLDVLQG